MRYPSFAGFYLVIKIVIQRAGIVKGFVEPLTLYMDAFLADTVVNPAAGDGDRGVGRRDAGVDIGANGLDAGFTDRILYDGKVWKLVRLRDWSQFGYYQALAVLTDENIVVSGQWSVDSY